MTKSFKKSHNLINLFFCLIPPSLILGNFFTNLNIFIFILISFFSYKNLIFKFKYSFIDKIIFIFFGYTFVVLLINNFNSDLSSSYSSFIITKTIFFLRYLILYISIRVLVSNKILNINYFFISSAVFSSIICFDIFIQYIFGKNIIGIKPISKHHFSGFFGSELIAGGFLQKFSLFCIFFPFLFKKKINLYIFQFFVILIFFVAIILSGNRMSLLLFLISIFIYSILDNTLRKKIVFILIISFFSIGVLFFSINKFKTNFTDFIKNTNYLVKIFILNEKLDVKENENYTLTTKPYEREFYCFGSIWKKNPLIGGGLRSYRNSLPNCNTHPHNYYFEILTDLGFIGFLIVFIIIATILMRYFINEKNLSNYNQKIFPFFLIFITEFFPIRSSGSFFSTNNSSVIFAILAILISLIFSDKFLYKDSKN